MITRLFLSMALLCLIFSSVFSQSSAFSIGLEGGAGVSFMHPSLNDSNGKLSYAVGALLVYNVNNHIAICSGIGYDLKGENLIMEFIDNDGNPMGTDHLNNNFKYLDIPLMLKISSGTKIDYYGCLGLNYALMLDASSYSKAYPSYYNNDVSDAYKSMELGLLIGLGVSYNIIEKLGVSLELRNNLGLTDVNNVEGASPRKSNVTNLLIGLSYNI